MNLPLLTLNKKRAIWVSRCRFGAKLCHWQIQRKRFPIHEIRRIDCGRGFRTRKNVFRIGGITFYDRKNKIPIKILEFKRSAIRLIAEFHGIRKGFPNQATGKLGKNQHYCQPPVPNASLTQPTSGYKILQIGFWHKSNIILLIIQS